MTIKRTDFIYIQQKTPTSTDGEMNGCAQYKIRTNFALAKLLCKVIERKEKVSRKNHPVI